MPAYQLDREIGKTASTCGRRRKPVSGSVPTGTGLVLIAHPRFYSDAGSVTSDEFSKQLKRFREGPGETSNRLVKSLVP